MLFMFYLFVTASVAGALGVLAFRNPVYSAMSLVSTFFCLGVIYIMLNAEFVAVIQVLVYAGAIMVLFLFVIMLLNIRPSGESIKIDLTKFLAAGLTIGILSQLIGLFLSPLQFGPSDSFSAEAVAEEGSIAVIGRLLYGEYVLPFEIIAILLLVAVIGAVVIGKRRFNSGNS